MVEVLLCRDCRFVWIDPALSTVVVERLNMFALLAECHHPTAREETPINLVSGAITVRWKPCSWHREKRYEDFARTADNCGPEARWFEPKEPPEPVGFVDDDGPGPRSDGALATDTASHRGAT
jgi:hypothetical protein